MLGRLLGVIDDLEENLFQLWVFGSGDVDDVAECAARLLGTHSEAGNMEFVSATIVAFLFVAGMLLSDQRRGYLLLPYRRRAL